MLEVEELNPYLHHRKFIKSNIDKSKHYHISALFRKLVVKIRRKKQREKMVISTA